MYFCNARFKSVALQPEFRRVKMKIRENNLEKAEEKEIWKHE